MYVDDIMMILTMTMTTMMTKFIRTISINLHRQKLSGHLHWQLRGVDYRARQQQSSRGRTQGSKGRWKIKL